MLVLPQDHGRLRSRGWPRPGRGTPAPPAPAAPAGDDHGAGLEDVARWRSRVGQEAVLLARRPRRYRAGRRRGSRELAMTRRSTSLAVCCAPIRIMPRRAAALGDVEEDLLDRAAALARRVLVELVEDDELQRPWPCRTRSLSSKPCAARADDEALGPVVEVVDVDHRDLLRSSSMRCLSASVMSARMRWLDVPHRRRAGGG